MSASTQERVQVMHSRSQGPRRRRQGRHRHGYTLVFFAMFFFAFMALAALVIDIGFARLTQRQMQLATDAASLEGVRFRDELPPGYALGTNLESARRQQASDVVQWTFDDDFNVTNGDVFNFGAGPNVELGAGIDQSGEIHASQLITATGVYKPTGLEPNLVDAAHGDMVAGSYDDAAANHREDSTYARLDFTPKSMLGPTEPDNAFLIRMRRLHADFDLLDTEAGVSSRGPELQYLWGRGAPLPVRNDNGDYLPRKHGVTVRATAIANARPAMTVGAVQLVAVGNDVPGATPFALRLSAWESLDNTRSVKPSVKIVSGELEDSILGQVGFPVSASQRTSIGAQIETEPSGADWVATMVDSLAEVDGSRKGYVILYDDTIHAMDNIVIGFGLVTDVTQIGSDEFQMTIVKNRIASTNASSVATATISGTIADAVLQANKTLEASGGLLAPYSAR